MKPVTSLGIWCILFAALIQCGCGSVSSFPESAAGPISNGSSGKTDGIPLVVTDGLGRRVTLPAVAQRVVSLAPKNTELVFALGVGERLVGATTFCTYPPQAASIAKVGGFSSQSISIETVLSLRPDVVLCVGELHRPSIEQLERLNVPVLALGAESLAELYREIDLMGRVVGAESQAARLVSEMQQRVAQVQARVRGIPPEQRVTVFYQVWDDPLSAAGPASYLGELIELAGGENIVSDRSAPYVKISEEVLLKRDPQVIIAPSMGSSQIRREDLVRKPGWGGLRAVQEGRIYVLDGDLVSRCGPRLVDALETMARHFYPQHFDAASASDAQTSGPGSPSP